MREESLNNVRKHRRSIGKLQYFDCQTITNRPKFTEKSRTVFTKKRHFLSKKEGQKNDNCKYCFEYKKKKIKKQYLCQSRTADTLIPVTVFTHTPTVMFPTAEWIFRIAYKSDTLLT